MVDKIEVGQRWSIDGREFVVLGVDYDCVKSSVGTWMTSTVDKSGKLLAPAPKPGQMWRKTGGGTVEIDRWDVESLGVDTGNAFTSFAGSPAAVARWLLDNGYECVEEKMSDRVELIDGMRVSDRSGEFGVVASAGADFVSIRWNAASESSHYDRHVADEQVRVGRWAITSTPEQKPRLKTDEELRYELNLLGKFYGSSLDTASGVMLDYLAGLCGVSRYRSDAGDTKEHGQHSNHPNIAPLKSLADLVAQIYETPAREQSRRYVDMAVAQLRGEPFAKAIQAVLVAASEKNILTPRTIRLFVEAAGAWEKRRNEVAPGKRALSIEQRELCHIAAMGSCILWGNGDGAIYERARAAC